MKRLVWLLLIAFSTVVVQVQPVQAIEIKAEVCGCCEPGQGACDKSMGHGMDDCATVCVTCTPALNFELPPALGLPDTSLALIARYGATNQHGPLRADRPLLTPPRLLG